jgi:peptide/nickel transport system substrate-binding protein
MYRFSHSGSRLDNFRPIRLSVLTVMLMMVLGFNPLGQSSLFAAEAPDKGGIVVWAVHETMASFDIHYSGSYIGVQPISPIYNGLLTQDPYNKGRIVGDLAESWEVSEDGKQITFHLHKGVKFHDGSDFTCADAQYSVEKLTDKNRAQSSLVGVVKPVYKSSRCSDDYTLVLSLKRPSPAMLNVLSASRVVMMKQGIAERFDRKDTRFLVGTGPFKFKSYTPGVDFQAVRNPNYWKPGLPHIAGYRAVVMSDLTKIFAAFRAHQLTMTGIARHLERPEAKILERDFPNGVVAIGPRACWDNFVMNVTKPPFNDARVRKAVALATDRKKMIEIAVEGWGAIGGYIGPHTQWALPSEELMQYPQYGPDMEKRRAEARRLLAEAGYPNGLDVDLMLRRGPLYERGALSRQDDLKKIGINVIIGVVDTPTLRKRERASDFTVYTAPSAVSVEEPDYYYARLVCNSPSNYGKYCNPEFDKLFTVQSQTLDPEKRVEILHQMERILLKDIPDDHGYYWKSTMGYWNRLKDWPPVLGTTVYNFGRFERVWCQEGRCM